MKVYCNRHTKTSHNFPSVTRRLVPERRVNYRKRRHDMILPSATWSLVQETEKEMPVNKQMEHKTFNTIYPSIICSLMWERENGSISWDVNDTRDKDDTYSPPSTLRYLMWEWMFQVACIPGYVWRCISSDTGKKIKDTQQRISHSFSGVWLSKGASRCACSQECVKRHIKRANVTQDTIFTLTIRCLIKKR